METGKSPYLKRKDLELKIEMIERAGSCIIKYVTDHRFGIMDVQGYQLGILDVREYKNTYLICFVGEEGSILDLALISDTDKTKLDDFCKSPFFWEHLTNLFDEAVLYQHLFIEKEIVRIIEKTASFEEKEEEFALNLQEIAKVCPIRCITHEIEGAHFEIRKRGDNYLGVYIGDQEGVIAAVQIGEPESRLLDRLFFDNDSNPRHLDDFLKYTIIEALEYQDRFFQA